MSRAFAPFLLVCVLASSSCAIKNWWGEPAEAPLVLDAEATQSNSSNDEDCMSWTQIYEGNESDSSASLECWVRKVDDLWTQVRGVRRNQLTETEIARLIRSGVVDLPGDREMWIRRIFAAKKLLGFGGPIDRGHLDSWISWIRAHRGELRSLYQKFIGRQDRSTITYDDAGRAAALTASLFRKLGWTHSVDELGGLLQDIFAFEDPEFRAGTTPGVRLLRNIAGALCPIDGDQNRFDLPQMALCLERAQPHFAPAARWFEFMANAKENVLEGHVVEIRASLEMSERQAQTWFTQNGLQPLIPQLFYDFAVKIGAKPPKDFVASLRFIRRFKAGSTENAILPVEFIRLFALIRQYENSLLDAIPHFARAYRKRECLNADASNWKTCVLADPQLARKDSSSIDLALRVKNPRHGRQATPLNGSRIDAIVFFDAVASQLIEAFDDDRDSLISADLSNDADEVVQLITTSVETFQAVDRFVRNLDEKLAGKALLAKGDENIDLNRWDIRGFAKLITISHDVLVERTPERRFFLSKFMANFYNLFPRSSVAIDRESITAILTTIDTLPDYRRVALETIFGDAKKAQNAMDRNTPFPRELFNSKLQEVLRRNFPNTHEGCVAFGFEISCGIAFDEILSAAEPGSNLVKPSDLDVLTILSFGVEGVFSGCDSNGDRALGMALLDGEDELDCAFTRFKDGVQRLIQATVIRTDGETKKNVDFLLETVNSTFITRSTGKTALIRGTKSDAWLNLPFFFYLGKKATIGSAYGLMSDIVRSDRVKAINSTK